MGGGVTTELADLRELRVAAYTICVRDDQVLLARWISRTGPRWTLPGGGLDHGEDPYDGAIRETREETGYVVAIDRLLGIDSQRFQIPRPGGVHADHHSVRVIYAARVVGGDLRYEVGGSTDQAAWFGLDQVGDLDHVELVDIALELDRTRPPLGRITVP